MAGFTTGFSLLLCIVSGYSRLIGDMQSMLYPTDSLYHYSASSAYNVIDKYTEVNFHTNEIKEPFCKPTKFPLTLSWCHYDNPFLVSNFLSDNGTTLIPHQIVNGSSVPVPLNYTCTGEDKHDLCEAVTSMQAGTTHNEPKMVSESLIVMLTRNGQVVAVNFNTNTMQQLKEITENKDWVTNHAALVEVPVTDNEYNVTNLLIVMSNSSVIRSAWIFPPNTTETGSSCVVFNFTSFRIQQLALSDKATRLTQTQQTMGIMAMLTLDPINGTVNTSNFLFYASTTSRSIAGNYSNCNRWQRPENYTLSYWRIDAPSLQHDNTSILRFIWVTNERLKQQADLVVVYSKKAVNLYMLEFFGHNDTDPEKHGVTWTAHFEFAEDCDIATRNLTTLYCVNGTEEIVYARLFFDVLHAHENIEEPAAFLIVAVTDKESASSRFIVVSIDELFVLVPTRTSVFDPLGLGSPPPCDRNTEWWTPNMTCEPRFLYNDTLPSSSITTVSVSGMPAPHVNVNVTVNVPFYSHAHYTMFVAYENFVSIYGLFFRPPKHGTFSGHKGFQVEKMNEIAFIGIITSLWSSPNGQHLFATVARRKWEIDSIDRLQQICNKLSSDPKAMDSPFLSPFAEYCEKYSDNIGVGVNTFVQYVSICVQGVLCPSLTEAEFRLPKSGEYAARPAVIKNCPEGNFCLLGSKHLCPPGFVCPYQKMTQPIRCNASSHWNLTCFGNGLTRPQTCPDGQVCIVPHIPGTPSGPGTYAIAMDRTHLFDCQPGDYCNLGAHNETIVVPDVSSLRALEKSPKHDNVTIKRLSLECPSLFLCLKPSVMTPQLCDCRGDNATLGGQPCDHKAPYCPVGTHVVTFCPVGNSCHLPNETQKCLPSQYCPLGTYVPELCPAGSVCPTPDNADPCPAGYYCQKGSVSPTKCAFLTVCHEGSTNERMSFAGTLLDFVGAAAILIFWRLYVWYQRRKATKNAFTQSLREEQNHDELDMLIKTGSLPTSPTIAFDALGLELTRGPAKGKRVLNNVTGTIPGGSFVAVMGPSGSGKTTFIHTLAGKAFYGKTHGKVFVNGSPVNLSDFRTVTGFVKQDDIMHRELTVRENLMFCANARYDYSTTRGKATPKQVVQEVMHLLDLSPVANSLIGDEEKRGISGGQRKRVNIGMELASCPAILFLDEPTSGLDSASSMLVCRTMRRLAQQGMTIIAVVHQPRYEIFTMFHKVLLLARGGKTVYYGPPEDALPYFESLKFRCPEHVNPPDFFMDVISGEQQSTEGHTITPDELQHMWAGRNQQSRPPEDNVDDEETSHDEEDEELGYQRINMSHAELLRFQGPGGDKLRRLALRRRNAPFYYQCYLFLTRAWLQLSRSITFMFMDLVLVLIAGLFLGLVFSRQEYIPPLSKVLVDRMLKGIEGDTKSSLMTYLTKPVDDPIISIASLSCMAIGMTGVMASLRVFGDEKWTYWREAGYGLSTLAYFLAKNTAHLIFIILSPLVYLSIFTTLVTHRGQLSMFYMVLLIVQFSTTGLGYLLSVIVPSGLGQLAGVVTVLVLSMFGGARPTLPEIAKMWEPLRLLPYMSYIRWAQEAWYLVEIKEWNKVKSINVHTGMKLFDYHFSDLERCLIIAALYGIAFRVLAYFALVFMHREQKR